MWGPGGQLDRFKANGELLERLWRFILGGKTWHTMRNPVRPATAFKNCIMVKALAPATHSIQKPTVHSTQTPCKNDQAHDKETQARYTRFSAPYKVNWTQYADMTILGADFYYD